MPEINMTEDQRQRALSERRVREDQDKRNREDAEREKEREKERDRVEQEHLDAMEEALNREPADAAKGTHDADDAELYVDGGHKRHKRDALDRVLGTGDNDVRRMPGGSHSAADGADGKPAELRPGQSGYLGSQPGQRDGGDGVIRDENNNVISPAVGGEAGNAATAAPDGRTSPPAQNVTPPVGGPELSGKDAISSAAGFNAIGGGDPDNGNPEPKPNEELHPATKPKGKKK